MQKKRKFDTRYKIIIGIFIVVAAIFTVRLFSMQIIKGEEYTKLAEEKQLRKISVSAPRGEIYDRFGKPLITNEIGYSIQIQRVGLKNKELNELVLKLSNLVEESGFEVEESLPISEEPYEFDFSSYGDEEAESAKKRFLEDTDMDEGSSAADVIDALKEKYEIDDGYDGRQTRKIAAVRYEMTKRVFSVTQPYTIAENVDMNLVTKIKENKSEFSCVSVGESYYRKYNFPTLASHILGRVGKISKEEYDELKSEGYKMNDYIGKQGIEGIMEQYLKGTDGYDCLMQTPDGFDIYEDMSKSPESGNYVMLTIDASIQESVEDALAQTILKIRSKGGDPSAKSGGDAYCGAAVVMDVHNADILAVASYPTYNNESFSKDYNALLKDKNMPLWNRAFSAAYPPGSTFKMCTAVAALESGAVEPGTVIYDTGIYKFYPDYQPRCWVYKSTGGGHGPQTVSDAIKNSCNYYFYEAGRLTGIETMNEYSKAFGFGSKTGVELSGEEAAGRIAGPEDRKAHGGSEWMGGDTLQAAIGQSENLMTPLQLANYICTLVNGGTRYRPHLIKCVKSATTGEIVYKPEAEVMEKTEIQKDNIDAILSGMLAVTQGGTSTAAFRSFPLKVGAKTGSAQVQTGSDNGVFVAFAPYDDPQIAVAVIVEHGNSGSDVAPVALAAFNSYFGFSGEKNVYSDNSGYLLR